MNKYEVTVKFTTPETKDAFNRRLVIEAYSHAQAMEIAKGTVWVKRNAITHKLYDVQVLAVRQLDYTEPTFTDKLVVILLRPVTGLARKLLRFIRRFKDE